MKPKGKWSELKDVYVCSLTHAVVSKPCCEVNHWKARIQVWREKK